MEIDWKRRTLTADDGARLAVFTAEPQGEKRAGTAVLAHGWTLSHASWEPVVRLLLEAGVRVVAWDQRGHGDSTLAGGGWRGRDESVRALGDDLALVLREAAESDAPLVLAGHSMGGMTIMAFAGLHPDVLTERVAGVTLVATSAGGLRGFKLPAERYVLGALSRVPVRPGRLMSVRSQRRGFGVEAREEDVRAAREQIARTRLATTGTFFRALMAHDEMTALAALAHVPVRVFVGTKDVLTPPRHARALAEAMPSADLDVLEGRGHMLTYEAPREVADSIIGQLRA